MTPNILVVEDEDSLATLLQYNLQKEGYSVTMAGDGEEALLLVDEKLPDLFMTEMEKSTKLKKMLTPANQAAGWRSARDWSYTSTQFHGDGWVCVGDSAAFVDPLFSTGVALATLAGSTLAKIVDEILKHPQIEAAALDRYATAYRGFFDEIRMFVERFYDRTIDALKPERTIGIAFAGQEVEALPHEPHDIALDCVITESGVRNFRTRPE